MKHLAFAAALLALSLPATVEAGKTDFEKAEQKVGKFAVDDLCVVETFNPAGERTDTTLCSTFVPLAK